MSLRWPYALAAILLSLLTASAAFANEAPDEVADDTIDEILVFGRAIDLVGAADSASERLVFDLSAAKNGLVGSLRIRHFCDAPLLEDKSARKDGTTLVNLDLTYPLGDLELGVDALNRFDAVGHDIEYFYASQLTNEATLTEDFHFHPVELREFRLNIRYHFNLTQYQ